MIFYIFFNIFIKIILPSWHICDQAVPQKSPICTVLSLIWLSYSSKLGLWSSIEDIISLILWTNLGHRFDLPKVTQHLIGGPKTSNMLTPGAVFSHTNRKLRRERKKLKRTKRNQSISLYYYLVWACRTGMTLPSLLSRTFSFPESLSRTSCFIFFRAERMQKERWSLVTRKHYGNSIELKATEAYFSTLLCTRHYGRSFK